MREKTVLPIVHPLGELTQKRISELNLDTFSGKVKVTWDPESEVTPFGQLSFFIDFLKTSDLFSPWVSECPLIYTSPNAPSTRDILGTMLLSILSGHKRYSHITTIRSERVNADFLGMKKVVSEDSVRRAFKDLDSESCNVWQINHLRRCWDPLLYEPWILDIDSTVKPLYGHQEGAKVGYNPHKPGRPSHVYHSYLISNLRLILDVEVQPGNQTSSKYSAPGLFSLLDMLPYTARPLLIRGDIGFGNENVMNQAEERKMDYLFKLRQTKNVKRLIERLFKRNKWIQAGQGWEGSEDLLKLSGWSCYRRVIVLRREIRQSFVIEEKDKQSGQMNISFAEPLEKTKCYEYAVLITSSSQEILTIAQLYRDRADAENVFDELKNQWSWTGFTTRDIQRCNIMARNIALIYNWWSIYVRLAMPEKHREAITSRPLLLHSVGRKTTHARQKLLTITSNHGSDKTVRRALERIVRILEVIKANAEQLDWKDQWRWILSIAMVKFLQGKQINAPPNLLKNDI